VFTGATEAMAADVSARMEGETETYTLPSLGKINFHLRICCALGIILVCSYFSFDLLLHFLRNLVMN
jgi:hypothetical protein